MPILIDKRAFFLTSLCLIILTSVCKADETYREPIGINGSYKEVTKNDDGVIVRESEYNRDGKKIRARERNLKTGETTTETYEANRKLSREVEDENGKVIEKTSYRYDKKGRLIEVDVKQRDGSRAQTHYTYGKNGKLISVTRGSPSLKGKTDLLVWGEDGQLSEVFGDYQDLLKPLGKKAVDVNAHYHVYKDKDGNTITVSHNKDGSLDYTIVGVNGLVITNGHLGDGLLRCPKGEKCPLHRLEKEQLEGLKKRV